MNFYNTPNEILNFLLEQNMINLSDVQAKIYMNQREELLKQHPYKIGKLKDGRTYTYVSDVTKKEGRRKIAKATEEQLLEYLYNYYSNTVLSTAPASVTMLSLYANWLSYKATQTNRSTYVYRLDKDWIKYYLHEELSQEVISTPLQKLDKISLEKWAYQIVKKYEMTKKCYYNMSHIIRSMLDYAVELKVVDDNLFSKVKIKTNFFKKKPKPKSETQVFTKQEQEKLINAAHQAYVEEPENILYMMIPMFFLTGMRLGELSALEFDDIHEDYIFVHQFYAREEHMNSDGTWDTSTFEIISMLKRNAPFREVLITPEVHELIRKIKIHYAKNGEFRPQYVFIDKNGKHPHPSTVDSIFYRLCDNCRIPQKSPHKSRKTYISTLIDSGMNLNFVREQVGHEDEQTTLRNYCFNRATPEETKEQLIRALAH